MDNHTGIDHHAYRHEKHGTKQVLDRVDQPFDSLSLSCFSQNGTHDKGTKGWRKSRLRSDDHHCKAKPQRDNQQRFVAHQLATTLQQTRNEVDAHHEPQYQEEHQLQDAFHHFGPFEIVTGGHRRKHHHQDDSQDIFQNQHTEHQTCKLFLAQTHVIESLVYNSGGRHGNHTAQKEAIHPLPSETRADSHTQQNHAEDNGTGSNDSRPAHLGNLLDAEVESQRKKQEDNTNIGPRLNVGSIHYRRRVLHVRTGQEARHYIPQHQGLFEFLKQQRHQPRAYQYQGQVADQCSQM